MRHTVEIMRRVIAIARVRRLESRRAHLRSASHQLVAPDRAPRLLTTLEQRLQSDSRSGHRAHRDSAFHARGRQADTGRICPATFWWTYCTRAAVLVGDNFRFGHRASGIRDTLRELGERYGFDD